MVSDSLKQCSFDVKNSKSRKARIKDEMLAIKKELRGHRRENREAETTMRKVSTCYDAHTNKAIV